MRKLYEKHEIGFALCWIGLYVVGMNIGLQFAGGLDDLAGKRVTGLLAPVGVGAVLAVAATLLILRNGLGEKYGLCRFRGSWRGFLFFVPLLVISLTNFRNGLCLPAPLPVCLLMAANMAIAGYVEEIIFRGFLFRAMAKENLRSAVIVSAVTFGAGHIVNLCNTADWQGVLMQVGYAIVIGFLFTAIVYRGGSLWPCIISHVLINGSSVFARETGPFTQLLMRLSGHTTVPGAELVNSVLLAFVAGAYALWLWKRTEAPARA